MIIYRPQRGSLYEAMTQAKEFKTIDDMKDYIFNHWFLFYKQLGYSEPPFLKSDIVIDKETINDDRNGWQDTRYVCVKRMGNKSYSYPQCIGFCATKY